MPDVHAGNVVVVGDAHLRKAFLILTPPRDRGQGTCIQINSDGTFGPPLRIEFCGSYIFVEDICWSRRHVFFRDVKAYKDTKNWWEDRNNEN